MTHPDQYLKELQQADMAAGQTHLRTLLVEFAPTLQRLPRLQQEVDGWLAHSGGAVDYNAMAARLEPQLAEAADWLFGVDMLAEEVRQSDAMLSFLATATKTVTSRTISATVKQFEAVVKKCESAVNVSADPLAKFGYVDNKNGTLTDTKTGLMWKRTWEEKCSYDAGIKKYVPGAVRFAGFDDWRMPTIGELRSLIQEGQSPSICELAFPSSKEWFWSSSPDGDSYAWYVNFDNGSVGSGNRNNSYAVRLVRASQ